jgi:hypothetical protein
MKVLNKSEGEQHTHYTPSIRHVVQLEQSNINCRLLFQLFHRKPPLSNYVKFNLDATFFVTYQIVCTRACLRDETSNFISVMTTNEDVVIMLESEAKTWSLLQGLQ